MLGRIMVVATDDTDMSEVLRFGRVAGSYSGGFSPHLPTGIPINISSVVVVTQVGAPPMLYMGIGSRNQFAVLDCYSANVTVTSARWRTPGIRIGDGGRQVKRRLKRVRVYGEGTLLAGSTMTANFDNDSAKQIVMPFTPNQTFAALEEGVLWYQEFSALAIGRQIDIDLSLNGTNIVLRTIEVDAPEI